MVQFVASYLQLPTTTYFLDFFERVYLVASYLQLPTTTYLQDFFKRVYLVASYLRKIVGCYGVHKKKTMQIGMK